MNPLFDRNFTITAIVVALPFAGTLVYNTVSDPLAEQRLWMRTELAQVNARPEIQGKDGDDKWQDGIASRPSAWGPLTEEPPPPPPEKPKAPEAPNVREMLKDVFVTRAQIGDRIRVITPNSPKGEWMTKGAAINGCVLSDFDKEVATFSFDWKEGNKTLTVRLPRE